LYVFSPLLRLCAEAFCQEKNSVCLVAVAPTNAFFLGENLPHACAMRRKHIQPRPLNVVAKKEKVSFWDLMIWDKACGVCVYHGWRVFCVF
jgi:hypothetical protein